jgi:hypothetical protein
LVIVAGRGRTAEVCCRPRSESAVVRLPLVDDAASHRQGTGSGGGQRRAVEAIAVL